MAKKQFTDSELESILNSLDGIQKAEPAQFFYTRLSARMQREEQSALARVIKYITRPAFAIGISLFFLILNGYFLLNAMQTDNQPLEDSTPVLAIEYSNLNNPFYETNGDMP